MGEEGPRDERDPLLRHELLGDLHRLAGLSRVVARDELERPAEHSACRVDLLERELDAHLVGNRMGGQPLVAVDVADPDRLRGGGGQGRRPRPEDEGEGEAGKDGGPRDSGGSGDCVFQLLHGSSPVAFRIRAAGAAGAACVARRTPVGLGRTLAEGSVGPSRGGAVTAPPCLPPGFPPDEVPAAPPSRAARASGCARRRGGRR